MNLVWSLSALAQGLVGGVATLVILAIRAAIESRPGPTFADLWTALAVGIAVGSASFALPKLTEWQIRRSHGAASGHWVASSQLRGPSTDRLGERAPDPRTADRFDRFTDRARRVLTLAQDEAQRFEHRYIGTEHLLLGLIRERGGTASLVLQNLGVDPTTVRTAVEFIIGRGNRPVFGEIGLTAGAQARHRAGDRRGPPARPSIHRDRAPADRPRQGNGRNGRGRARVGGREPRSSAGRGRARSRRGPGPRLSGRPRARRERRGPAPGRGQAPPLRRA